MAKVRRGAAQINEDVQTETVVENNIDSNVSAEEVFATSSDDIVPIKEGDTTSSLFLQQTHNAKIGATAAEQENSKYCILLTDSSSNSNEKLITLFAEVSWKLIERPEDVSKVIRSLLGNHFKTVSLVDVVSI